MLEGSPDHEVLSGNTSLALRQQVHGVKKLEPDEANTILSIAIDMDLLEGDKVELTAAINSKILQAQVAPAGDGVEACPAPKQECPNPESFLSGDIWELLQDPASSVDDRLHSMMCHFLAIGLWYPTENAIKNIVAVVLHDQVGDLRTRGLGLNKKLKASIVTHRGKRARVHALPANNAWEACPQEFMEKYPEWNAGREIVACPIQTDRIECLKIELGCRTTKSANQRKVPTLALQLPQHAHMPAIMPSNEQLQQMWLANQQRITQQKQLQPDNVDIPIQFLSPQQKQQRALPAAWAHDVGSNSQDSQTDSLQLVAYSNPGEAFGRQCSTAPSSPEAPPSIQGGLPFNSENGLPSNLAGGLPPKFSGGLPPNFAGGLPSPQAVAAQLVGFPSGDQEAAGAAQPAPRGFKMPPALGGQLPHPEPERSGAAAAPAGMVAQLQKLIGNKRKEPDASGGEEPEEQGFDTGSPPRRARKPMDEKAEPAGSPKRVFPLKKRPAAAPAAAAAAKATACRAKKVTAGRTKHATEKKLPAGWTRQYRTRKSGASAGHVDTYYIAPSGEVIDSWKKVLKKLAHLSR